jgi:hypothetical protein
MGKVEIRTTMQPDKPVVINEDDVPQLRHQGVLHGEPVPVRETAAASAAATPPAGTGEETAAKPAAKPQPKTAAKNQGSNA